MRQPTAREVLPVTIEVEHVAGRLTHADAALAPTVGLYVVTNDGRALERQDGTAPAFVVMNATGAYSFHSELPTCPTGGEWVQVEG